MEEFLQKVDDAIATALGGKVAIRGEALIHDIRARAGREPAELFAAVYARADKARVRLDIQTSKGMLRIGLDGGVSVRHPNGNWLLPVEVDEEESCLRVRELLLEILKAAMASPKEVEVKVYPV